MLKRSEVLSLPTVDIHDREALPQSPAVYFLITSDRILYIGGTKNLFKRWHYPEQHHRYFDAVYAGARLAWMLVQTKDEAFALEEKLVKKLKPARNKANSHTHRHDHPEFNATMPDLPKSAWAWFTWSNLMDALQKFSDGWTLDEISTHYNSVPESIAHSFAQMLCPMKYNKKPPHRMEQVKQDLLKGATYREVHILAEARLKAERKKPYTPPQH